MFRISLGLSSLGKPSNPGRASEGFFGALPL